MAEKSIGASASECKTKPTQFLSCNSEGDMLFAVNAGVPVQDALAMASCIFDLSKQLANTAAEKFEHPLLWSLAYQIEMGKAALDSAIDALSKEANHD